VGKNGVDAIVGQTESMKGHVYKTEVLMKLHQFCHLADEKMALDAAEIDHLHVLITRHSVAPPCTGGALTKSPFMHLA
jgi:hypothetical protein